MRIWALTFVLLLAPIVLCGQELTPEALVKLGTASWPTYNGDYSGQRHSPLDQINTSNVASLSSVWMYRATNYGAAGFGSVIKSTPIEVNGVLYFTMPDNVWAVDARSGREVWHYKYPPNEGGHIGQRGVAEARRALDQALTPREHAHHDDSGRRRPSTHLRRAG